MARSDGFGRGALHGALIGVAALGALSLALPVERGQPEADGMAGDETVAAVDSGSAETGGGASDASESGAAVVPDAPEIVQEDTETASLPADEPQPAAADTSPETRMGPPVGSEFARSEDLPPSIPGEASAPGVSDAAAAPEIPVAESLPRPVTVPVNRPEAIDLTRPPQQESGQAISVQRPSPDALRPVTVSLPEQVAAPAQDEGPNDASRNAPEAPATRLEANIPAEDTSPDISGFVRAAAPEAPEPADVPQGASVSGQPDALQDPASVPAPVSMDTDPDPSAEADATTRSPVPPLASPDPQREAVPPPPATVEVSESVLPDDDTAEIATASPQAEEGAATGSRPDTSGSGEVPSVSGQQASPGGQPDLSIPSVPMPAGP
ncbi:hypothetical protein [Paracoccus aerodenitrificans]|uniref:hypothetical protein n=1 Tax=Paracoccus aerodenitrificans TaxID=3017781 RepID=UPI0022F0C220|nr:hypothetical protein [Paracoccus aerodenitrificans]WBU63044.1 hypothetical protein PAE61_11795 [Paracoccus aerodenitrificans]